MKRVLLLFVLALLAAAIYPFGHIVRCALVDFADFNEIGDRVYVSGSVDAAGQERVTTMLAAARQRIGEHYGATEATPVIIVAGDDAIAREYGLNDTPGVFFFAPWGNYLVLNFQRLDLDVTAHELVHAETVARVGYLKRQRQIPVWFDEGAALQVDRRPRYMVTVDSDAIEGVMQLDTPEEFWSSDKQRNIRNYQAAKAAVAKLFADSDRSLYAILSRIADGESFEVATGVRPNGQHP